MSEFFEEYTHIVAEPLKTWPYFDTPGRLRVLRWSVDECYGRITPQGITEHGGLTRHAVVQLALYTCQPFRDIPPPGYPRSSATEGYIIDEFDLKNGDKKQRKYPCRSVISVVEALATALLNYEVHCELLNGWQHFKEEEEICLRHLENAKQLLFSLKRRGITRKDPTLKHRRILQSDPFQEMTNILQHITEGDYQRAGGRTNTPHNPWAQFNKWMLLGEMEEAFRLVKWRKEATYRALAAIMNQMEIYNAKGKKWTPNAIKTFLARPPDPRLKVTIKLTRPHVVPWYTRPK